MSKSRAYTEEEVREKFLHYVRGVINYWNDPAINVEGGQYERLRGVAFSIMVAIDGEAIAVPGFKLIPDPHPDDRLFHIKNGENWYPDDVDIAGELHSQLLNPPGGKK